jgi:hypothetical protein
MKYLALAGLLVAMGVNAQGFTDEPTCYSWNGGHKSAGSFSKCGPELHAWVKPHVAQPPVAVPQAIPVQAPPIMMPACQNQSIPLKPKHKGKPKPKPPKKVC